LFSAFSVLGSLSFSLAECFAHFGLVHVGSDDFARDNHRPAKNRFGRCRRDCAKARSPSAQQSGKRSAKNVLPYALGGILTSSILGIARVAGETAPIMFTAAYAMRDEMPWAGEPLD
jgi:hypothetical protein